MADHRFLIVDALKNENHHAVRQWNFDAVGQPLADAFTDGGIAFEGRDPSTLPFRRGDYVIAYWCGDLVLGVIEAEPFTPEKVNSLINVAQYKVNFLDSSDDCYLVDFTDEGHGHPSVASVFPASFRCFRNS